MIVPEPVARRQPLPFKRGKGYSVESLLVSPLRFCGRQWMRMRSDNNNQISQVALKILTALFLACATLLSGLPAVIGTLFFSSGHHIPEDIEYHPTGDIGLLRKDTSNEQIAERIKERLRVAGCNYSIEVRSRGKTIINDWYPENVSRYITLTNPSSTAITRFWETLKNHFYNKDVPSLRALHLCIHEKAAPEWLAQLKDVLALHKAVTFYMAFDLVYIRTELDRGSFDS